MFRLIFLFASTDTYVVLLFLKDLKDYMRQSGEVTYADAHKQHKNEGYVMCNLEAHSRILSTQQTCEALATSGIGI